MIDLTDDMMRYYFAKLAKRQLLREAEASVALDRIVDCRTYEAEGELLPCGCWSSVKNPLRHEEWVGGLLLNECASCGAVWRWEDERE